MDYDIFNVNEDGTAKNYIIATDVDNINVGETVILVNSNCEFEFDNVTGNFSSIMEFILLSFLQNYAKF